MANSYYGTDATGAKHPGPIYFDWLTKLTKKCNFHYTMNLFKYTCQVQSLKLKGQRLRTNVLRVKKTSSTATALYLRLDVGCSLEIIQM